MQELDIRDISIIDSFPMYFNELPTVLTVGCGECRLEGHLSNLQPGMKITATDKIMPQKFPKGDYEICYMDIFDPYEFHSRDVVICAQVLEHLSDWKTAFKNLLDLAEVRVIITVPYMHSFHSPDHVNFWNDESVQEFKKLAMPYSTAISKIRTKPEDAPKKGCFLIVVDKNQKYGI